MPIFYYCRLQELKVQEQFWVHMNGILRNWKILPTPSEKNLPLHIDVFRSRFEIPGILETDLYLKTNASFVIFFDEEIL